MIDVTPELLARHDRPGPRYTSYPTAVEFDESVGPEDHAARLREASRSRQPLSLYLHLPFCAERCSFCACHVVVTRRMSVAAAYLDHLEAELRMVAELLGERRVISQYHWGGGTPTHHPPEDLERLHRTVSGLFTFTDDAELAVEVDPRVTTSAHLELLADLGFDRLSMGVQDLDPTVQELIGRNQTAEQTESLYRKARRLGFRSVNFDLVYGLPGQTEATLAETLEAVIALRPDRLAVYSFAYVPWMRPHQRRIDEERLPGRDEKFRLLATVIAVLVGAGYRRIGMDHFALPDDDLAVAADEGTLTRNFMGYTTQRGTDLVAVGTSGISDVAGAYSQNHRRLASYYQAVEAGILPVERGYRLTDDDLLRRHVITELMCNGEVDLGRVSDMFGVDAGAVFAGELAELGAPGGLVDEGMVTVDGTTISVTELGSIFVRRVAAVFDVHTRRRRTDGPMFSKAI